MRPSVAALILLLAFALLGSFYLLRPRHAAVDATPAASRSPTAPVPAPSLSPTPAPVDVAAPNRTAAALTEPAPVAAGGNSPTGATAPGPTASTTSTTAALDATGLRVRIGELNRLAMRNDPASLQTILGELTNASPILEAAREAAKQYGSRDAIPTLREAAAATEDPQENAALIEAADYLQLPSLTELKGKLGTNPKPPRRQKP